MKKLDLSIIVVSFNTEKVLADCLISIKNSSLKNTRYETIVVDNFSRDNTVSMLNTDFKWVNLIKNNNNLGFAKANNIGVRKSRGKYILFLNPDTILKKNVLEKTLEFLKKNKDVAVCSPKVLTQDGTLDDASHRGFPTPWNAFCYFSGLTKLFPYSKVFSGYTMGWELKNSKPHEVDSVVGAYYLVKREAGEMIGWWDEDYFWYGDELDFSYRLKKVGWKIYFLPDVEMLHLKGFSSGLKPQSREISTANKHTRLLAANASVDAMKIFYKKHYLKLYPGIITLSVFMGIELMRLYRKLKFLI